MDNMSAKDRAFEKERVTYRQKVRELQREIRAQAIAEYELRNQLAAANDRIREQEDWIRRLLEYMDVPGENLQAKIKTEETFSKLLGVIGCVKKGGGLYDGCMR